MKRAMPDYLRGNIINMHCHFFPETVFQSIWDYFTERLKTDP